MVEALAQSVADVLGVAVGVVLRHCVSVGDGVVVLLADCVEQEEEEVAEQSSPRPLRPPPPAFPSWSLRRSPLLPSPAPH